MRLRTRKSETKQINTRETLNPPALFLLDHNTERERQRETERETHTHRGRQAGRERERERERGRQAGRQAVRERERRDGRGRIVTKNKQKTKKEKKREGERRQERERKESRLTSLSQLVSLPQWIVRTWRLGPLSAEHPELSKVSSFVCCQEFYCFPPSRFIQLKKKFSPKFEAANAVSRVGPAREGKN